MKYVLFVVTSLIAAALSAALAFVSLILLRIKRKSEGEVEYIVFVPTRTKVAGEERRGEKELLSREKPLALVC